MKTEPNYKKNTTINEKDLNDFVLAEIYERAFSKKTILKNTLFAYSTRTLALFLGLVVNLLGYLTIKSHFFIYPIILFSIYFSMDLIFRFIEYSEYNKKAEKDRSYKLLLNEIYRTIGIPLKIKSNISPENVKNYLEKLLMILNVLKDSSIREGKKSAFHERVEEIYLSKTYTKPNLEKAKDEFSTECFSWMNFIKDNAAKLENENKYTSEELVKLKEDLREKHIEFLKNQILSK